MQSVKTLLKQSQISKKSSQNKKEHHKKNIQYHFIPTHYEELIKYFIVHWEYFYSNWYIDF